LTPLASVWYALQRTDELDGLLVVAGRSV